MKTGNKSIKKTEKQAVVIATIPIFILIILEVLRDLFWIESVWFWIRILFIILILIPAIFSFIPRDKKPKWMLDFSDLTPIYFGFVIMLISFNTDIIPQMARWDISMSGLGAAIAVLGISLLMHKEQKPVLEELRKEIATINSKIDKLVR